MLTAPIKVNDYKHNKSNPESETVQEFGANALPRRIKKSYRHYVIVLTNRHVIRNGSNKSEYSSVGQIKIHNFTAGPSLKMRSIRLASISLREHVVQFIAHTTD